MKLVLFPVNGRVIVAPESEVQTSGGIVLPSASADEKPEVGHIVGLDIEDEHPLNEKIKVGTKVVFNKFAATEFERTSEGIKKLLIMTKDNILLVYEEKNIQ